MMRKTSLFALLCLVAHWGLAQLQSPKEFLGYELGSRFTPHHKVVDYFNHVARNAPAGLVKLQQYGQSYEGRPLLVAFVSSAANMAKLDDIRQNNLRLTGLQSGSAEAAQVPAIVWLSYNVHGNESVSTEAAMATIYELLNPAQTEAKRWLENTVVAIDPCINPDGRDRYVNWYNQMVGANMDIHPSAREHAEPWPGGRFNHYLYDLNRDWAWQSQQESQQRVALYHQWMPHVHVDFHEMGVEQPYYFAPAAEPYHKEISNWQRELQVLIGRNHAKYFDKNAWLYFTKETFDLLYPSYGDSWPTFNGAIGMTYEQGGSGRAGLGILTSNGDTLTLKERIDHHHWAGLSTIEASWTHRERLVKEFKDFYDRARNNPGGTYKTFVISGSNPAGKLAELRAYLDKNLIQYGTAAAPLPKLRGFNYHTGSEEDLAIGENDIVISTAQPKSVMVKVLFNPRTVVSDSVTYDATAWAVPYAWGLKAHALAQKVNTKAYTAPTTANTPAQGTPYAYLSRWKSFSDLKFLGKLLNAGVRVRFAEAAFKLGNQNYEAGTLVITRTDNLHMGSNFAATIEQMANNMGQSIAPAATGFADGGADFGSGAVRFIQQPKIALLAGEGVSATSFGELWHYFDRQLEYPVTVVQTNYFNRLSLADFNVIVLPAGYYRDLDMGALRTWVRNGGKLIALESALNLFADQNEFGLKTVKPDEKQIEAEKKAAPETRLRRYGNRERDGLSDAVEGSVFQVQLDNSHPLAFGFDDRYYTLKRGGAAFEFMRNGWNVGVLRDNAYIDGFAGSKVKQKLKNTLVFGVENIGGGSIVYMVDNPVFRSSWPAGKLLFGNAVFFVGQ